MNISRVCFGVRCQLTVIRRVFDIVNVASVAELL